MPAPVSSQSRRRVSTFTPVQSCVVLLACFMHKNISLILQWDRRSDLMDTVANYINWGLPEAGERPRGRRSLRAISLLSGALAYRASLFDFGPCFAYFVAFGPFQG